MRRPRPWVIVPGIWNSGPDHWQSRWQAERETAGTDQVVRIGPASWSDPDPADWSAAISRAVASCDEPPVLVAHSLGVLAVASWLREAAHPSVEGETTVGPSAAGAFLVAPPDPAGPGFPAAAAGFAAPDTRTSLPTRMVVSDDDPYCSADRAIGFARTLGSSVLRVGALGHVNVDSGVGAWAAGRALLEEFERGL
ncbi:alpha/beta hydrolase [Curtobacterium sp. MCPF17_002]|uniref:RBBP9/YdeN family alpha/beta hydrolase n=1 Tax=Curtobacterium sp. MCPF17_002 TaxID=2175645 RepID=UPI000DA86703|nr:alpha/beta hydrolase [Curtobacterium sp. MCPF17_002]WIB79081.1 alpha/beta hydrolase [Curtobacterium sp. MCPF17_002]